MLEPIRHTYTRPWLYPKQLAAIFTETRYSLIEAGTKAGKTFACILWIAEKAMLGKRGQQFWWIAPVYHQARIAYRRLKNALPEGLFVPNDSAMTITLVNGATIVFRSGEKPDPLYGEDVHAMVIDEASRLREEAWHAARSTLTATRGPVRIIGNVRGRKNWMYRLARRAESGESEMEYHRITADDAVASGVLDAEEIRDAESVLPEAVYRELYYAEASDDQGNPFGAQAIEECIGPLSDAAPEVWAWDLAKRQDWTVGGALDRDGGVCRLKRFQLPWEETVRIIRTETGNLPALIDSTGVGDPIVERLQRDLLGVEGFVFTSMSKQRIMEGLAVAIQHREVTYPEGPIALELRQFEYVYTRTGVRYSAPEGAHDDCVCMLALAVQMRSQTAPMSWRPVEEAEKPEQREEAVFWEA